MEARDSIHLFTLSASSQQRSRKPVSLLADWPLPSALVCEGQVLALSETMSASGHDSSWEMSQLQIGENLSKLCQLLSVIGKILSENLSTVSLCVMLSEVSRSVIIIYWTAKGNAKNDFILIYFEKGAWYTLIMNKFIKSNFLQNLNKIFIVINTSCWNSSFNNATVVINKQQFLYVKIASQWTHLISGMNSVSVYHGRTTTSHGVNKPIDKCLRHVVPFLK